MRLIVIICFLLFGQLVQGQVKLSDSNINISIADKAVILEDPNHEFTIEDILNGDHSFDEITHSTEILDFNSSRWWLKISVTNTSQFNHFILELARPITNKVFLYEIQPDTILSWQSGDDYPFLEKAYDHRKALFEVDLDIGETKHYIIELESDGEVIILPLKFWERAAFFHNDYVDQMGHGF